MKKWIAVFSLVLIFIFINTYIKCKNENLNDTLRMKGIIAIKDKIQD